MPRLVNRLTTLFQLCTLRLFLLAISGTAVSLAQPPPPPQQQSLVTLLHISSGVFRNGSTTQQQQLRRTVLVTAVNHGYLNHLRNFKCFLDRLQMKALVFALDASAHDYISRSMNDSFSSFLLLPPSTAPAQRVHGTDAEETQQIRGSKQAALLIEESSASYRTHQFHIITTRKLEAVLLVLQQGYDVLFVDVDVVLLRDPFPQLLFRNVDFVFGINRMCPADGLDFWNAQEEGNTGLFFMRSTRVTLSLLESVIQAAPLYPGLDDQSIFWKVIRQFAIDRTASKETVVPLPRCRDFDFSGPVQAKEGHKTVINDYHNESRVNRMMVACPLDGCAFSVGALRGVAFAALQSELSRRKAQSVAIHCNWLKGNAAKQQALQKHGFWLAGDGDRGECKTLK